MVPDGAGTCAMLVTVEVPGDAVGVTDVTAVASAAVVIELSGAATLAVSFVLMLKVVVLLSATIGTVSAYPCISILEEIFLPAGVMLIADKVASTGPTPVGVEASGPVVRVTWKMRQISAIAAKEPRYVLSV